MIKLIMFDAYSRSRLLALTLSAVALLGIGCRKAEQSLPTSTPVEGLSVLDVPQEVPPSTNLVALSGSQYCRLLQKERVAEIVGVEIVQASALSGGCAYDTEIKFGSNQGIKRAVWFGPGPTDLDQAKANLEAEQQRRAQVRGETYIGDNVRELPGIEDRALYLGRAKYLAVHQIYWVKGDQGFTILLGIGAGHLIEEPERREVLIELAKAVNGNL